MHTIAVQHVFSTPTPIAASATAHYIHTQHYYVAKQVFIRKCRFTIILALWHKNTALHKICIYAENATLHVCLSEYMLLSACLFNNNSRVLLFWKWIEYASDCSTDSISLKRTTCSHIRSHISKQYTAVSIFNNVRMVRFVGLLHIFKCNVRKI